MAQGAPGTWTRLADRLAARPVAFKTGLLVVWATLTFGLTFFARDITWEVAGWPVNFWFAAQGCLVLFVAIVVVNAWVGNRTEAPQDAATLQAQRGYEHRLHRTFGIYVVTLLVFLVAMGLAERAGLVPVGAAGFRRDHRRSPCAVSGRRGGVRLSGEGRGSQARPLLLGARRRKRAGLPAAGDDNAVRPLDHDRPVRRPDRSDRSLLRLFPSWDRGRRGGRGAGT